MEPHLRPVDPLTGAQIRPFEIIKSVQVQDAGLRASGIAALLERLRKYEEKWQDEKTGEYTGKQAIFFVLPCLFRLSYEW